MAVESPGFHWQPSPVQGRSKKKADISFEEDHGEDLQPFGGDIKEALVPLSHCGLSEEAAAHVYSELECIRRRLKEESERLSQREDRVAERERKVISIECLLHEAYATLQQYTEEELSLKWKQFKEETKSASERLEQVLREKDKENKRLRDSFDTLKHHNETLKRQLSDLQAKNGHLENQLGQIQGRLNNLQRLQKLSERDPRVWPPSSGHAYRKEGHSEGHRSEGGLKVAQCKQEAEKKKTKAGKRLESGAGFAGSKSTRGASAWALESVGLLLEWVSLPPGDARGEEQSTAKGRKTPVGGAAERCCKLLPSLCDSLPEVLRADALVQRQFLHFLHWSLSELAAASNQRPPLSATLRRIGNAMLGLSQCEDGGGAVLTHTPTLASNHGFCQSVDSHVRTLAVLVSLRTVVQADHLAFVFDTLQEDLVNDYVKQLFLEYGGVSIVLPFIRPGKPFCSRAVDIYLLLSTESVLLQSFLSSLCCHEWFRNCVEVMKSSQSDVAVLEKLSVVLQKLSKLWRSRKFFETHQVVLVITELLHSHKATSEGFLVLNLQSVVRNLAT